MHSRTKIQTKNKVILLFVIILIIYILLNIFVKQFSNTIKIIFGLIWVVLFWTLIYWLLENIDFLKNLQSKCTIENLFKLAGIICFLIFIFYGIITLPKYEGTNKLGFIGSFIIIAIVLLIIFYFIGLLFSKIEKSKRFDKIPLEIKTGLMVSIFLTSLIVVVGFLATFKFPNLAYILNTFIISFIIGVIMGFIGRIYDKFFIKTSKLFKNK